MTRPGSGVGSRPYGSGGSVCVSLAQGGKDDDGIQNIKADVTYAVPPGGGTITSFSFESVSDKAGQQLDFLVLHPPARG